MTRRIVIVRHGERVDFTFGMDWFKNCFDSEGTYTKTNLNMPDSIEKKEGMPSTYHGDSPLTQVGHFQGFLVGKGLFQEKTLRPGFTTFVSPAIRSIQTCTELLKGMQENENEESKSSIMKIEPALFEWTGYDPHGIPSWLSPEELEQAGYVVDRNYKTFMTRAALIPNEPPSSYYNRSHDFLRHLIDENDNDDDILIVAHGITLDAATRQLFGNEPRTATELWDQTVGVPYAAVGILQCDKESDQWTFQPPQSITMKHTACHDFEANKRFPR